MIAIELAVTGCAGRQLIRDLAAVAIRADAIPSWGAGGSQFAQGRQRGARFSVAIETETHTQRAHFLDLGHVRHVAMAHRALQPGLHVHAVMEVDEVSQRMHASPVQRTPCECRLPHGF